MGAPQSILIESNNSHPFHIQFEAKDSKLDVVLYDLSKGEDKKMVLTEKARFAIPCSNKDKAVDFIKHIRWAGHKAIEAINARAVEVNAAFEHVKTDDELLVEMVAAEKVAVAVAEQPAPQA